MATFQFISMTPLAHAGATATLGSALTSPFSPDMQGPNGGIAQCVLVPMRNLNHNLADNLGNTVPATPAAAIAYNGQGCGSPRGSQQQQQQQQPKVMVKRLQPSAKSVESPRAQSHQSRACKKRMDLAGYELARPQATPVARRNERERNRVKQVNMGFEKLREHVPSGAKNKKMSKVDTLKAAVSYINHLQKLLDDTSDGGAAMGEHDLLTEALTSASKALQSLSDIKDDASSAPSCQMSPSSSVESASSPSGYSTGSSSPSSGSQESLQEQAEDDYLDFSSWFQ